MEVAGCGGEGGVGRGGNAAMRAFVFVFWIKISVKEQNL